MSKYRPKFAKMLRDGMRKDGMFIEECCKIWGVSRQAYYDWLKIHPKFKAAAEQAETEAMAWWAENFRKVATGQQKGNAGLLHLVSRNYLGLVDKVETTNHYDEEIKTIKIEMLPNRQDTKLLENIIDVVATDA